jgi:riboflavin kinase/FMN adenylyltransferase
MKVIHVVPKLSESPMALTIGNFDGVHRGHQAMISILREAARRRNLPAGVLTFEPHAKEFFHPRKAPHRLTDMTEKAVLLEDLGIDSLYVCAFNAHMAKMPAELFVQHVLVTQLRVRWLLVGDDFRFGAERRGDLALLRECGRAFGFEVETMPTLCIDRERVSSTAVREALAQGNTAKVATLLGRPHLLPAESVNPF